MRGHGWLRVVAWSVVGLLLVAGAVVFAVAKRPSTTPRYPADAWTGQSTPLTGWLTVADEGGTSCWVINTGYADNPDSRVGLVLPDSYRAFAPALIDRGSGDPVSFISGNSLWAGAPVVTALTAVDANVRLAEGDAWRDAARAQWDELCSGIATVNVVAVVEPGSLAPVS